MAILLLFRTGFVMSCIRGNDSTAVSASCAKFQREVMHDRSGQPPIYGKRDYKDFVV